MHNLRVKEVLIIGDGMWGNALQKVVCNNHSLVKIWDRKSPIDHADIVILAVPTIAIRDILVHFKVKTDCIIVNTSKGIEKDTHLLPFQIVKSIIRNPHYFTLIGPSFAQEVNENIPTIVNIGYKIGEHSQYVKNLFQTKTFRVKLTKDVEVIELFAAFKNVYAIASGIARGLGLKANTQAKLTVLALEELYRMMHKRKLSISSQSLSGTVGDLVLTTYSEESRNFRFGKALVSMSTQDALKSITTTVEGYNTASSVRFLALKYSVHLPLANLVYDIIVSSNPSNIRKQFTNFLQDV